MPFSRFMDLCLYHPDFGYYRRDRFGTGGDFYTAEQIQPVFGRLMAAYIRTVAPAATTVVELGAGRREMADAFAPFNYIPVDIGYGALPERFDGVVFSNEFFDALPVDILVRKGGAWFERRVGPGLAWDESTPAQAPPVDSDDIECYETQDRRVDWLRRIADSLQAGTVVTIDYGYTRRELIRFPQGTLMTYRAHKAEDDALSLPGRRDITAHVDFTALMERGEQLGLRTVRLESLSAALLRAGEKDNFASALAGDEARHRLQLKTLLFGMGETFRVLVQEKAGSK
jgi:SAM-dependent MidA family methyltransferase